MPQIVNFVPTATGPNLIEEIDVGGDNSLSVLEIFSEWKQWLVDDPGARLGLPQAFSVVGGEPKSPTTDLGQAFFLHPDWKIRPAERDHRLVLVGDIQALGGAESIVLPTLGGYTVLVEVVTSALITGLGAVGLTAQEVRDALKLAPSAGAPAAGSVDYSVAEIVARVHELWALRGLDIASPAVHAPTSITFAGVTLTITEGPAGTHTVQRQ